MPEKKSLVTTKVATLALPTREAHVTANVWPGPNGMLLFLAEVNLAPQTRQEFLQAINLDIERSWPAAKLLQGTADQTLELVVNSINTTLGASERLLGNPLSPRYQLMVGYLSGQQVALASLGHIDAFVINVNKLINVLNTVTGKRTHKPSAFFDHIVSGELAPGESLLLATTALTDYFSWERLRQLIGERAPGLALREIERYMLQLKVHPPLGLVCLQLSLTQGVAGTDESLNHLLQTKAQTASLLQPKFFSFLKDKFARAKAKPLTQAAAEQTTPELATTQSLRSNWSAPHHRLGLSDAMSAAQRLASKLSWLKSRESAKSTIAWWLETKRQAWNKLPNTKRAILFLGLIVLLAFSQSIVNLGRSRLKSLDSELYNQLVTQITEKQAALEAALIYGDDAGAMRLYDEAAALLKNLPNGSRSRAAQRTALEQTLLHLAKRLQRLTEISNPDVLAQLPEIAPQTWQTLVILNQTLYAASANKLIALSTEGKLNRTLDLPGDFVLKRMFALNHELLLISEANEAIIYSPNLESKARFKLNFELYAASFYGDGLYFLSETPRTIYRAARQGAAGLGKPTLWLRASQGNLPQAVDLTVDGSIFVATASEVSKFQRGLKTNFSLGAINPPLSNVTSIYTSDQTDYLYLWENVNKRLLALDKTGKLVTQLILPTINSASLAAVDGSAKTLYLISDNKVYRVPILPAPQP